MLEYFIYRNLDYGVFAVDEYTIIFSMLTAALHFIIELLLLYLEAKAIQTSLVKYIVVCYNARQGWIPLEGHLKSKYRNDHEQSVSISFEDN